MAGRNVVRGALGSCSVRFSTIVSFVCFFWIPLASIKADNDGIPFLTAPAVAYHPRGYSPHIGSSEVTSATIRADLLILKESGFRSIVTYSSEHALARIPKLAREIGIDGTVIMGVWDPGSEEEIQRAIQQASYVDGFCVGNEGLGEFYDRQTLANAMSKLKEKTGLPVTTSEPIDRYIEGPLKQWLIDHSDWVFPIAHPFWASRHKPAEAVSWIVARFDYLSTITTRRIYLKEVGMPTAGEFDFTETDQAGFYSELVKSSLPFFYFEAFDQPWKPNSLGRPQVEAYWGLYNADGTPKEVIRWLKSAQ